MICDTPRILVAGTGSGCGKTTVSMALLAALKSGLNLRAFKCGPDYIDPMFHERVLHVPCRNLDSYLLSADTVRYLFAENSRGADLALIEGVMGYFDGLENGDTGSTHEIAKILADAYDSYDGFVVLHGTDTMAYTSSALSFMLEELDKPVILTGSQIPLCELRSDGRDNLISSMLIAAEGRVKEVCAKIAPRIKYPVYPSGI